MDASYANRVISFIQPFATKHIVGSATAGFPKSLLCISQVLDYFLRSSLSVFCMNQKLLVRPAAENRASERAVISFALSDDSSVRDQGRRGIGIRRGRTDLGDLENDGAN